MVIWHDYLAVVSMIEVLTVTVGFIVSLILGILTYKFSTIQNKLGRALTWILLSETIIVLTTVIFAMTTVFDTYALLTPWTLMGLRNTIFFSAGFSGLYLYRTIDKL